jgi:hypothetical protein
MKLWILTAAALTLAACAMQGEEMATARDSVFERFTQHMNGCTERYGYDPDKTDDLGPHQLGSNEREWDACVYDGVERILAVNSPVPKAYTSLIAQHKELTDQVEAGKITRAERRKKIETVFESIRRDEDALRQKQAAKQRERSDREALREIERVRRDVERTQRTLLNSM